MTAPVDGIVWLKPPIMVDAALAGESYKVEINKRPTTLTLPTESAELEELDGPPAIPDFPPPPLADGFARGTAQARIVSGTGDHELAAGAVRLQWHDPELGEAVGFHGTEGFSDAVDAWVSTVRDWLYAWAARPGHEIRIRPTPVFRLAFPDDPERGTESGGGSPGVIVLGERAATREEWESALRAASAGEGLPLPYKLLSEAILHNSRREPRHTVITACSAAEVALGEAARAGLKTAGWKANEIKQMLKGANGLIDLYRVCAALPAGLPVSIGQTMAKLAGPRNDAAHDGVTPDRETAAQAIRTAKALVGISPLPTTEAFVEPA